MTPIHPGMLAALKRDVAQEDDPFWKPYDQAFYQEHVSLDQLKETRLLAHRIFTITNPRSVIDIGCGLGTILQVAEEMGIPKLLGIDHPPVKVDFLPKSATLFRYDLRYVEPGIPTMPIAPPFDLVVCLETAEHLPPGCAIRFVQFLCSLGDTIVFSAAIPGVGGRSHLNEQPPDYWQSKFASWNFEWQVYETERILGPIRKNLTHVWYYPLSLRVYRRTK